jgi:FkbH-like protein
MNPNKTPDLDYRRLIKQSRQIDATKLGGKLKVALLSDAASQQFVPVLRALFADNGIDALLYEGNFDAIELEALDTRSGLHAFAPDIVYIINSTQALRARYYDHGVQPELPRIERVWDALAKHTGCRIVQCNFALPYERPFGQYDFKGGNSLYAATRDLNSRIAGLAAQKNNVLLCDVESIAAYVGRREWFDDRLWDMSKTFCNLEHLPLVAQAMVDIALAGSGKLVKCVICDLDNTLWGGIVGDAGPHGIEIASHGDGEAFYRLQKFLVTLRKRGILLAVCSKNDRANAVAAFERNPEMALKMSDFAVFVANWENKADNIRQIRDTLEIGFDSMVFLDDNPFERNLVRNFLPEVIVPELPEDPADYVRALSELNLFETTSVSAEDLSRAELYKVEAQRRIAQASFTDVTEYLKSLQMKVVLERFPAEKIARIVQLFARSNQFNLTTQRHTEAACTQMMQDEANVIPLCASLSDQYGDHGLISIVVARPEGDALRLSDWLMSCRVLKRGVENYLMNHAVRIARERGLRWIKGQYIPTSKNSMVKEFYAQFGFESSDQLNWTLDTQKYSPREHFISPADSG